MIKRFLVIGLVLFFIKDVQAQGLTISGTVVDQQTRMVLSGATVRLNSTTDLTFSKSFLSDSAGNFKFSELQPDSFQLSVSYVGFNAITRGIRLDTANISLVINVVPSSSGELATVVITSTPPPVTQKGDTLQISASQFKVNRDASTEDLVRKVPGVTIENGQVKAQGENVQKVTIDGRELFGDDATAALRNLPAEVVDKIQIFDRLSDQAQFTGFDDGNTSKSINIVTKVNMRNGQFGRVFAGYGTDDRYQAGGNATFFKDDRRISLVGNFNNINQQNFSQQDLLGVTSNTQRRGGGNRGGGGGPRGGGNRGGGNNFGSFGNASNFLIGNQEGINKTNAFGVNFSDVWGKKLTLSGSYFFNNTHNTTNETSGIQYLSGNVNDISNVYDSTVSNSRNNNHRINMRLEYRIDSNNQLIITPNLSFQDNESGSRISSLSYFFPEGSTSRNINQNINSSNRSGNNLSNNILYRHSFPKKGRTVSINLNTSYNKRNGETYVETFSRFIENGGIPDDTSSNRFADQKNNTLQLSTNLVYTEPIGQKSQLQFNYNPSYSKSESDQQTYAFDPTNNKYSIFLNNFSNVFENRTTAQNAGLTYRYGNRDKMLSFGVNYQNTKLESERVLPIKATVNKSFQNFLPNAMLRYKLSEKSNIRIFYRANVNQPSVTQLQDVLDPTNAPVYSIGNSNLDQQYMHTLSGRYTFTNTTKGLLIVGNIFYQSANDYIANASFNSRDTVINGEEITGAYRLSKPVNLDGYKSLRSFLTFAVPLKFIKSNFNLNGGITISNIPGIINAALNETKNTTYTAGAVLASNISEFVDFTLSYTANFNDVKNKLQPTSNDHYFQQVAGLQLNLLSKSGWFFQNELNNQYYNGLSQGFNQNYFLWNMSAGKKILKDQKGELKLGVFDLLKQNRSITRNVTGEYIEDVQNQVLQQYFMLTFTYNLRNFGTAAAREANRRSREGSGF
ncbi:MAG TPA: TonB-dependent receptor [Flavisolibacter sp.]|nr:TonB-dependent receptor [Flavisolibacter sp.]